MRVLSIVVAVLGLFVLVLGIVFMTQAGSAETKIADEIQPLKVADVNATYDKVKASQIQVAQRRRRCHSSWQSEPHLHLSDSSKNFSGLDQS